MAETDYAAAEELVSKIRDPKGLPENELEWLEVVWEMHQQKRPRVYHMKVDAEALSAIVLKQSEEIQELKKDMAKLLGRIDELEHISWSKQ